MIDNILQKAGNLLKFLAFFMLILSTLNHCTSLLYEMQAYFYEIREVVKKNVAG